MRAPSPALLLPLLLLVPAVPAMIQGAWLYSEAQTQARLANQALLTRIQTGCTILWLDAREHGGVGGPEGSIQLKLLQWEEHIPEILRQWRPGTVFAVYCESGPCDTARLCANRLQEEFGAEAEAFAVEGGVEAALWLAGMKHSKEGARHAP